VHQHGVLRHEGATAPAGDDEVIGRERGDGLPHRVAVHVESEGELRLRRQFRAGGQ
jgi:hypothetical protein